MPESGGRPHEVSPSRHQMPLGAPNSLARRSNRPAGGSATSGGLLEGYHDIASAVFSVDRKGDPDEVLLTAARDGDYEKIFSLLRRRNEAIINIDVRDRISGNTPLIWAAKRGHGKIVELLLKHGVDVTLRNYEGQTAVEVASPAIRGQLLESVDKGGPHRNLLQAAWQGNARLVKKILSDARVDINCRNSDGLTPLLLVTRDVQLFEKLGQSFVRDYDPQHVVSELLTYRADPNSVDKEGRTPLHHVSSSKAAQGSSIAKMLLRDGSNVDARDIRCSTAIHCAAQGGNVDIIVALLNGGSDANARGYAGTTPLHISAINGHDMVVTKLLEHGADVTIVDDSGLTPVEVAKTKKVKASLKQAWAEATHGRGKEQLGPVRCPSSTSIGRPSSYQPPPAKSPKKGGQVIFDLNPGRRASHPACSPTPSEVSSGMRLLSPVATSQIDLTLPTSSTSSVDALTPRRAALTLLQRQLTNVEKVRKAEEQKMRDVVSAASSRSRTPSAVTPRCSVSGRRLSPLRNTSPHKTGGGRRDSRPSAAVAVVEARPSGESGGGGWQGSAGRRRVSGDSVSSSSTATTRENGIPVTILGLDLDDNLREVRIKRINQGPVGQLLSKKNHLYRSFSSESAGDPGDEFYLRGYSSSKTSFSTTTIADDWDDSAAGSPPPARLVAATAASASAAAIAAATAEARLATIEERSQASHEDPRHVLLDLDQMGMGVKSSNSSPILGDGAFHQHPNSQRLLPPTPVYMQPYPGVYADGADMRVVELGDFSGSSKENSPRTEDDMDDDDEDAFCGEVRLAVADARDLVRPKSVIHQGHFNIEATRVRQSNDSGCPEEEVSSSNRSSVNSADGQQQQQAASSSGAKGNARKSPGEKEAAASKPSPAGNNAGKSHGAAEQTASSSQSGAQGAVAPAVKLRLASKDNAAKNSVQGGTTIEISPQSEQRVKTKAATATAAAVVSKNQITVHSNTLQEDQDSPVQYQTQSQSQPSSALSSPAKQINGTKDTSAQNKMARDASSSKAPEPNGVKGTLAIKLLPKDSTTPQGRVPPPRPPPPDNSSAQQGHLAAGTKSEVSSKVAPPRPKEPPKSRTPSASSLSSSGSGSSCKDAPARPPPPATADRDKDGSQKKMAGNKRGTSTVATATKTAAPTPVLKPTAKKKVAPTTTTTFRLSTYLAQKEAMSGYHASKDSGKPESEAPASEAGRRGSDSTTASTEGQKTVPSSPAIILTSQSQKQFDLTKIPEIYPPAGAGGGGGGGGAVVNHGITVAPSSVPQVKQIQVREMAQESGAETAAGAGPAGGEGVTRPVQKEHNGPVIWDPFESIRAQQKQADERESDKAKPQQQQQASQTTRNVKSATKRKAFERQTSASRSNNNNCPAKTKGGSNKKSSIRPKSPRARSRSPRAGGGSKKTKKKSKKSSDKDKVTVIGAAAAGETTTTTATRRGNVALIGGLGWQIETECEEDENLKPVRLSRPAYDYDTDYDSDEGPTPRLTVVPNYLADDPAAQVLSDDVQDLPTTVSYLQLPGQPMYGHSSSEDDDEEEGEGDGTEETVEEVIFDLTPRIVNGVLVDVPPGRMMTSRSHAGYRKADIDKGSDQAGHAQEENETCHADVDSAEEDSVFEEDIYIPPLSAFDKKGTIRNHNVPTRKAKQSQSSSSAQKKTSRSHNKEDTAKTATTSAGTVKQPPLTSPKQTPMTSPKQTPMTSPKQTPVTSPKQTPTDTPKASPGTTPKTSPGTTPKQTPGSTPKSTPGASPKKTPNTATATAGGTNHKVTTSAGSKNTTSAPQPPPRKSKAGKNSAVTATAVSKPTPAKRSTAKHAESKTSSRAEHKAAHDTSRTTEKASKDGAAKKDNVGNAAGKELGAKTDVIKDVEVAADSIDPEAERQKPPVSVSQDVHEARVAQQPYCLPSPEEDKDIDAMIDEILKSTPHPSMSLSLKSNASAAAAAAAAASASPPRRPPLSEEELLRLSMTARDKLQAQLSKSQNGRLFCELPAQPAATAATAEEGRHHHGAMSADEEREMERLANTQRHMELVVSEDGWRESPPSEKPPLPPGGGGGGRHSDSRSSSKGSEKSPRFVRKMDSWKDGLDQVVNEHDQESEEALDLQLPGSDVLSDALSVASGLGDKDDGMVPKDGRVLTSRLGRCSAAGRASAMSNHDSSAEESVETIQWKRGNLLGQGAYGKVWCGLTNTGELIAVKQIKLNINDMEKAETEYEKIQEEVELLKTLRHTNIVGYLGTSLEDDTVSIFMQFVPGGSIANILGRFGALVEEVFCNYTKQILEGVAYLHKNNVIHRDIKGGNVMLMHNAVIKLIDFGCAKRLCLNMNSLNNSHGRLLTSMRGTPYWMAPEVVKETGYGTKSDIWSIGCTVFEMATRKPPWADVPPLSAIFAIGSDREVPQLPDKFSPEARDFVNQCLTRDQTQRPSALHLQKHPFLRRKRKK